MDQVETSTYTILISDLLGNLVLRREIISDGTMLVETLDIRNLPAGAYHLRIGNKTGQVIKNEKIIIK